MLLSSLATPLPRLPFGTLGAQFAIGAVFLIHIALVGFILAATGMAPFLELAGRRRGGDPSCLRYARGLSKAILYLYSLGATWAVLAVFLLAGLYGRLIGTLLNELLLPLTIAFASFFVGIPLMVLYAYGWDRFSPRLHLAVGFAFAAVQYVFLFTIVELDSYVLTPGTSVSAVGAAFSPSYPWLLLHYAGANLSWAPLLLAGIAVRGTALTLAGVLIPFTAVVWHRALLLEGARAIPFCAVKFDCGCGLGEEFICHKLLENAGLILLAFWLLAGRGRILALRYSLSEGNETSTTRIPS